MALFSDISGLRGENLASALLAHLLLRSEPIRRAFINRVSSRSKKGPVIVEKHFAVFTEAATDEQKRLDILVQTDNAIVGIENKFSASFQPDQPKSYLSLVETKANDLGKVWGSSFQALLVVLAPEDRESETVARILKQGISDVCIFLSWQGLLERLNRDYLPDLGPVDRFLVTELEQYADAYMGTADLSQLMDHIDNPWQERGSSVVKEVFNSVVWPLINEELRVQTSYSGGIDYHGYYLCNDREDRPWIGFMNRERSPSNREGASFVVALRSEPAAYDLAEETKGMRFPIWDDSRFYCVEVPYQTGWTQRNDWKPVLDIVNELVPRSLSD